MGIFISIPKTIECALIAVAFAALLSFTAFRQAGVLQSAGYSARKYCKWLKKKGNLALERQLMLAGMCFLSAAVVALCFSFAKEWAAVVSLAPMLFFFIVYFLADRKAVLRSKAVFTPRMTRLYALMLFIYLLCAYLFAVLLNFAAYVWGNEIFTVLRYIPLAALPALTIPLMLLSNCISKIYETPVNNGYIKKAKEKIKNSDIKIIGITGSYGKTSTKFILNTLLSKKYRVLTTPSSHNTPIGIALCVNSHNLSDYDIFIAEMGARHTGDISELCAICPPDVSVITGVCGQHLETFLTFENIVKAKGEILENTKEKAVVAEDCYDLFAEYAVDKIKSDNVKDIECSSSGTEFTLIIGGEEKRIRTKLLGRHSAYNIALAANAAFIAGMTADEIAEAAEGIECVEHRLQPVEADGVHILDDGYNSNVKGAQAAIDVLKLFGGKKIVVTPGLVELGVLEEKENFELGKRLVGLDFVILVGDTLVQTVKRGYTDGGGDGDKIVTAPTLEAAKKVLATVLAKGDTVLFLNDLPDAV